MISHRTKSVGLLVAVATGLVFIVAHAARDTTITQPIREGVVLHNDIDVVVKKVDDYLHAKWSTVGVTPAMPADDLTVLRRLSAALHGTIPSLEEIRRFEADDRPDRLHHWCAEMLADNRFADYFSERLARSFVGTQTEPFLVFRRDQFTRWLSKQLQENRPYDELVREMISQQGLWTDKPATNFITHGIVNDDVDENKLTGRTVRAFLGQRLDCAQCHDHPFDHWKQTDYEGLAAFYGQASLSLVGISDLPEQDYVIQDSATLEDKTVEPRVPFHEELLPNEGTRRQKLAAWVTHEDNRRFERAIANRIWALMFGKPYSAGMPMMTAVDDLPDPPEETDLLDILGEDFRMHGYDLRRFIQAIAASRAFQLSSEADVASADVFTQMEDVWAIFPLIKMRPEQVVGAMLQASSIKTVDQNSHLVVRAIRFFKENDFIKEYGDLGPDELDERSGTIPQALLRMNGELVRETIKPNLINSSGRISGLSPDNETIVETCYLVCLTRRPTPPEMQHFLNRLDETPDKQRSQVAEDIVWTLFNSPEFSWNH